VPSREIKCLGNFLFDGDTKQWFWRGRHGPGLTFDNIIGPDVSNGGVGPIGFGVVGWPFGINALLATWNLDPPAPGPVYIFVGQVSGRWYNTAWGIPNKGFRWTYVSPSGLGAEKIDVYYDFNDKKYYAKFYVCIGAECIESESKSEESSLSEIQSESSFEFSSASDSSSTVSSSSTSYSSLSSREPFGYSSSSSTSHSTSTSSDSSASIESYSSQSQPENEWIWVATYVSQENNLRNLGDWKGIDGTEEEPDPLFTNLAIESYSPNIEELYVKNVALKIWCDRYVESTSSSGGEGESSTSISSTSETSTSSEKYSESSTES